MDEFFDLPITVSPWRSINFASSIRPWVVQRRREDLSDAVLLQATDQTAADPDLGRGSPIFLISRALGSARHAPERTSRSCGRANRVTVSTPPGALQALPPDLQPPQQ